LKGAFIGIAAHQQMGDFARAVFEGMAFSLNECLQTLMETEPSITIVRLAGGGAKSAFWRSIIADVFGVRIQTTANEDASFGAALLGGIGAGVFKSAQESVKRCIRITDIESPDMNRHEKYERLYKIHVESSQNLVQFNKRISETMERES
jgi:xylulokinase